MGERSQIASYIERSQIASYIMAACPRVRTVSGFAAMVKQNFKDLTLPTLECSCS
jgi:hypothetical protein